LGTEPKNGFRETTLFTGLGGLGSVVDGVNTFGAFNIGKSNETFEEGFEGSR
jgi:hypothetical protein